MRSLSARRIAFAVAVATLVAACSSAYGTADSPADPAKIEEAGAADGPSEAGAADAALDGGDGASDGAPVCVAPKKLNGTACAAGAECCSNACTAQRKCVDACRAPGGGCTLVEDACCIGTYCSISSGARCATCIPDGAPAEMVMSTSLRASCCTGNVDATGKCAP